MLPLSPSLLPSLAAAILYAAATLYQGTRLAQGAKADKRLLVGLGVLALLALMAWAVRRRKNKTEQQPGAAA